MTPHTTLRDFVDSWSSAVATRDYAALTRSQPNSHATLGFGVVGTAITLSRTAHLLDRPALCEHAESLATAALADVRGRSGLAPLADLPPGAIHTSLFQGAAGIRFARAWIAHVATQPVETRRRIGELLRSRAPHTPGHALDLFHGSAGQLAGMLSLFAATQDPRLRTAADRLAQGLMTNRRRWRASLFPFAHGRAGIVHALLRWHAITGTRLPRWWDDELDALAKDARRRQRRRFADGDPRAVLTRSWCNGAAGMTLLWAAAFEHTRDVRYRRRAVASLQASLAVLDGDGSLCCGLGGRAYAALAVERIAPGSGARELAEELALGGIQRVVADPGRWPNGLLNGLPGLVWLAVDLLAERPVGFPVIEGL